VVEWLALMGYYHLPVDRHPLREGVRDKTNHCVTGRDGGRWVDLGESVPSSWNAQTAWHLCRDHDSERA
jgi:hypothetical protein